MKKKDAERDGDGRLEEILACRVQGVNVECSVGLGTFQFQFHSKRNPLMENICQRKEIKTEIKLTPKGEREEEERNHILQSKSLKMLELRLPIYRIYIYSIYLCVIWNNGNRVKKYTSQSIFLSYVFIHITLPTIQSIVRRIYVHTHMNTLRN